ncbi:aldo/keto reductase [Alicyclobacillus fodiniaquatilis]|uniref:Aldo/keto reductase n=1 Tax=Alicyclobacillus fodiniaquatilis TaxID=1661150 RepID=A0ABW4JIQ8_9BACL
MRYVNLPGTDLRLSALCLGTAPLGSALDKHDSYRILDEFVERGGNFIDTARAYAIWLPDGMGLSERIIGSWLTDRGLKDSVVVATKGAHPALETMHIPRLSVAEIQQDCEESLRALQLDAIPLYWLHRDDPSRPVAEILESMESLRMAGKIQYYGLSNWSTDRMQAALTYVQEHKLNGLAANQPRWSYAQANVQAISDPTSQWMDDQMFHFHKRSQFPVIPYTAQARGYFSRLGDGTLDADLHNTYDNAENQLRYERLKRVSKETGYSITVLALAWMTSQRDFLTIPIIWSQRSSHLRDILDAGDVVLKDEMMALLG